MKNYREALHKKVCSLCIDGIFDEDFQFVKCGLPSGRPCPIFRHLAELIQISRVTDIRSYKDFVHEVRERVCTSCEANQDNWCEMRMEGKCALNRYLLLVVGVIEGVRRENYPQEAIEEKERIPCKETK
jgi:hypothetical protein